MKELISIFFIYKPQGLFKAIWIIVRILILPYAKLDKMVPKVGTVVDIGCGNGGLTNYLALKSSKRNLMGVDLSKERISLAIESVKNRKNIKFIFGDATKISLPKVDCYIMVDVLHHIPFPDQEKLLEFLSKSLNKDSVLIIKDVDPSDKIPFLFGHIIEKLLYPKEIIYTRSKKEWIKLLNDLGLRVIVEDGVFYFPDSTKIFIAKVKSKI